MGDWEDRKLLSGATATLLLLNWIHSKTISVAAFHIIGLTKIPKIEFLPLDCIYHAIKIMMVAHSLMK